MSGFKDAIKIVIESIESDVEGLEDSKLARQLLGYARNLKIALAAASDATASVPQQNHRALIDQARAEFAGERLQKEEVVGFAAGETLAELTGTPGDDESTPTMVSIEASMPIGAKTQINGFVYVLNVDKKLIYSEEETTKWKEQLTKQRSGKLLV